MFCAGTKDLVHLHPFSSHGRGCACDPRGARGVPQALVSLPDAPSRGDAGPSPGQDARTSQTGGGGALGILLESGSGSREAAVALAPPSPAGAPPKAAESWTE